MAITKNPRQLFVTVEQRYAFLSEHHWSHLLKIVKLPTQDLLTGLCGIQGTTVTAIVTVRECPRTGKLP